MYIWVNQREYARPTPTAPVRGLASGLLAFHKRNCYSEHGSVELSNSSYVNTCPEPAQNHLMCCTGCFWDWRGREGALGS